MCQYTPPLLKKEIDEYFGLNNLYLKIKLKIWGSLSKHNNLGGHAFEPKTFIEFHFWKNGNQDFVKKMPIHISWAHELKVIFMLKDPCKK